MHDVGGYLPGTDRDRSKPGVSYLRCGRKLEAGMFITVEPGQSQLTQRDTHHHAVRAAHEREVPGRAAAEAHGVGIGNHVGRP